RSVTSRPRSSASRAQAVLIVPVPPMNRTLRLTTRTYRRDTGWGRLLAARRPLWDALQVCTMAPPPGAAEAPPMLLMLPATGDAIRQGRVFAVRCARELGADQRAVAVLELLASEMVTN